MDEEWNAEKNIGDEEGRIGMGLGKTAY